MTEAPLPLAAETQCVHCGFCLPACPTWSTLGTEMDTPRGRLALMDALLEGRVGPEPGLVRHLDLCLGCRACETECPSGVRYGEKLGRARELLHDSTARPLRQRLLERAVLAGVALPPRLQDAGAWLLREMRGLLLRAPRGEAGGSLAAGAALLSGDVAELDGPPPRLPRLTPARGTARRRVALLTGCVQRVLCGSVNAAAARLLAAAGCDVLVPRGQRCCGALHAHAGDRRGAQRLARLNIAAFERAGPLDAVVVTSAGCGSVLREYGELLADDPAWAERAARLAAIARDATELLAESPPPLTRPVPARVAYHDACHLAHAQGVRAPPRALLARVPGLQLVPLEQSDRCCGSAGLYNLLHPREAGLILRDKLERLRASGADTVAAGNPGCLLHLAAGARAAGLNVRTRHPLSILADALPTG
jgi:glycolate oxidase iron-sulfur subunit